MLTLSFATVVEKWWCYFLFPSVLSNTWTALFVVFFSRCFWHTGVFKDLTCFWTDWHLRQLLYREVLIISRYASERSVIRDELCFKTWKVLKRETNLVNMYLFTEWEGQAGKYLTYEPYVLTVIGNWYFPVRSDLTQSISILSYDHFLTRTDFVVKERRCYSLD